MSERFLPRLVGTTEAIFLRVFLVATVLWSIWTPSKYNRVEDAAGIATWGIPLGWIGQDGVHPWILGFTALSGIIYVVGIWKLGWPTLVGLLGMTAAHLGYWTLANSQGNTFHGSQMTTLVLLAQVAAWIIMAIWGVRHRWPSLNGVLLYFSQCAIAGVYVTSAITKILKSEGRWLIDSHYFAKSVQKVWRQSYYTDPSSTEFSGISPWALWLSEHPMMARLIFAPGFFLELFAFVILWNRAWAIGWGVALILMHIGISIIMALDFPEFEVLVFIFCVNLPYWLLKLRKPSSGQLLSPIPR